MRPVFLAAAVLLAAATPTTTSAQEPVPAASPAAIWISAGIGGGWTRISCAICRPDRNLGPAGYVRVGTAVRDGLLLGAEANGWTRDNGEDDGRSWTGSIGAVAYLYPTPNGSLFVKGGIGYLTYHADEDVSVGTVGVQLGAGYEFEVGGRLHITNFVNLLASSFGSLRGDNAQIVNDVSISMLQLGVGITRR